MSPQDSEDARDAAVTNDSKSRASAHEDEAGSSAKSSAGAEPDTSTAPALDASREAIDKLDRQLIQLLAERMRTVREIGALKSAEGFTLIRDEARERQIFETWSREARKCGMSPYFTGRVLREVLNYSRRDQERFLEAHEDGSATRTVRVGYQGVAASYSELTVEKMFATRPEEALPSGFRSFSAVVDALEGGELDYALLPIENTIAGSINDVYDLLAHRSISIVGEEAWKVEHCLLGQHGARIEQLRVVRSHPVALQQCSSFLDGLVGCVAETSFDTAGAARMLASEQDASIGAIASEEAARTYGLSILRRGISNHEANFTRFVLIARETEAVDPRLPAKTSLLLSVKHRHGALLECLKVCEEHGINLTKLESRPEPGRPWEYLFYVDLEANVADAGVQVALGELRAHTNHLEVLGCYPRRRPMEGEMLEGMDGLTWQDAAPAQNDDEDEAQGATAVISEQPAKNIPKATSDLRLVSRDPEGGTRPVEVSGITFGGDQFILISGPCAVETREQIMKSAALVKEHGAVLLRGGAFKPRSSPYAFQGLGWPGLDLLHEAGRAYEMPIVTEILRPEDVGRVCEKADMLQVGARNMQNFALLKEVGKARRPVLLKRGMSASVKDLLAAAEYIMAEGNQRVILCERGIRTFETATRNTLDVSAVPVLKQRTHLPVIVDPSHAAGVRELVVPLALAAAAAGADGLIVEAHFDPDQALCDKDQALTAKELSELRRALVPIVGLYGKHL